MFTVIILAVSSITTANDVKVNEQVSLTIQSSLQVLAATRISFDQVYCKYGITISIICCLLI